MPRWNNIARESAREILVIRFGIPEEKAREAVKQAALTQQKWIPAGKAEVWCQGNLYSVRNAG